MGYLVQLMVRDAQKYSFKRNVNPFPMDGSIITRTMKNIDRIVQNKEG